ncbi:mechanosensitive ion channel [Haliea sp. E1-2-M8]|uniref:mechanosensitive ion channel family protein n=1 Tax=Haliea sp. E1-2-M8 TaxID=3064706 RepID=UPI00272912BB|nr:mechanosensitive ion channel domain-containing protein [Haliea sp. E1-2-M8]MDO8863676.1 mechanosensitive ion channel [Haliea sp. E1-2-M8]
MFENPKLQQLASRILNWFAEEVWAPSTFYQAIMIMFALAFGMLVYSAVRDRLSGSIDRSDMPVRVKLALNNLQSLVVPLVMLGALFFITLFASSEYLLLRVSLATGVMKLLLAFMAIRIAMQFISNVVARDFFALTMLSIAALSIFGILDEAAVALDTVAFSMGSFHVSALAVIKSILSLVVLLYLATFISTFAERRVLKSKSLTRSSQVLFAKIVRIVLVTFALLIGVTSAGIDLSVFAVFSGAVGLGIGFGLQKVISNLFSGLLLLMDKSIKPGDVIELEESATFGSVEHMGARYTEIITRSNKSFLIPNEDFITQRVINWSHGNRLIRIQVEFGVHYDSDPHEVIEVAVAAAKRPPRVVATPEPLCLLMEFGDSSLDFVLRFWITDAEKGVSNVQGQVMLFLWDAFKENGIKIPYPHREVYMHPAPTRSGSGGKNPGENSGVAD